MFTFRLLVNIYLVVQDESYLMHVSIATTFVLPSSLMYSFMSTDWDATAFLTMNILPSELTSLPISLHSSSSTIFYFLLAIAVGAVAEDDERKMQRHSEFGERGLRRTSAYKDDCYWILKIYIFLILENLLVFPGSWKAFWCSLSSVLMMASQAFWLLHGDFQGR